jgi:hypothetical protein
MIGGGGYYMYKNKKSSDSEPQGSTLTITESGTSLTENYRMMPRRENYLQRPETERCYRAGVTPPGYCGLHDRNTQGFQYAYDLSITEPRYEECPGGGHDCLYIEKYDENGALIDIVDGNGVKLLDKMADDLWSDRWDLDSGLMQELKRFAEYRDDKLISKITQRGLTVGDEITMTDIVKETGSAGIYFIVLLIAMKLAGKPKPDRIVINVANAKNEFDKVIERTDKGVATSKEPPTSPTPTN